MSQAVADPMVAQQQTRAPMGVLARCFQEVFTVVVRLRSNRQPVRSADQFRESIKKQIEQADNQARQAGYTADDTRLARFAIVAFLDESILNARMAVFDGWNGRPLQQELFHTDTGGEMFFVGVDRLLERDESHALADVLEVYYLCLLLGFVGRYTLSQRGELRSISDRLGRKIYKIRGSLPSLTGALPTGEPIAIETKDRWSRRLMWALLGVSLLVLALYVFYWFSLDSLMGVLRNLL